MNRYTVVLPLLITALLPSCTNAEQTTTTKSASNNLIYFSDLATKGSPEATFNSLVATGNVVVDYYADWCGPCRSLGSTLVSIAQEFPQITFVKINIDTYKSLAREIRSIPVLSLYKNGTKIQQSVGGKSKSDLRALFTSVYGK